MCFEYLFGAHIGTQAGHVGFFTVAAACAEIVIGSGQTDHLPHV